MDIFGMSKENSFEKRKKFVKESQPGKTIRKEGVVKIPKRRSKESQIG